MSPSRPAVNPPRPPAPSAAWGRLRAAWLCLGDSRLLLRPPGRPVSLKTRILLLRLDGIGDFVLWLEAARALRRHYPADRFEITLLANDSFSPLAATLPCFDRVWSFARIRFVTDPAYRADLLSRVRQGGFDLVINPMHSREICFDDSLVRVSGAAQRIGSAGDRANIGGLAKRISDRWYSRLLPATAGDATELERNAAFLQELGLAGFKASPPHLEVTSGLPTGFPPGAYYLLVPGAGKPAKQWPLARFHELALRLHRATGWQGVICGGKAEQPLGQGLLGLPGGNLVDWTGRTSLAELTAMIAGARLLIGNDTGAVHIAAAVGTPAVVIMGGGHFGRFLPYRVDNPEKRPLPHVVCSSMDCYGCNWQCRHLVAATAPAPCLTAVSVDAAWEAVARLLPAVGE